MRWSIDLKHARLWTQNENTRWGRILSEKQTCCCQCDWNGAFSWNSSQEANQLYPFGFVVSNGAALWWMSSYEITVWHVMIAGQCWLLVNIQTTAQVYLWEQNAMCFWGNQLSVPIHNLLSHTHTHTLIVGVDDDYDDNDDNVKDKNRERKKRE